METTLRSSAPIEPGVGMAGIQLRMHIRECFDLIRSLNIRGEKRVFATKEGEAYLVNSRYVAYSFTIGVTLHFNILNGRLYKLIADQRYQGSLFGVLRAGMLLEDATRLEPRLWFDDTEDVWMIAGVKGVFIETDGWNKQIQTISVYITEADDTNGDEDKINGLMKGEWS